MLQNKIYCFRFETKFKTLANKKDVNIMDQHAHYIEFVLKVV